MKQHKYHKNDKVRFMGFVSPGTFAACIILNECVVDLSFALFFNMQKLGRFLLQGVESVL